jgi:hypothetical protein
MNLLGRLWVSGAWLDRLQPTLSSVAVFFFAFSFSSHEHVNSCELFNVCMLLDVITNGSFAECFTVQCHSAEYFLSRCHLCQP